mgnify:CR=1 FL=1
MSRVLPAPLVAHPPIIKTCGVCSHWRVPSADTSPYPHGDAGMAAQGLRPCAKSEQPWRYLGASHPCHLPK